MLFSLLLYLLFPPIFFHSNSFFSSSFPSFLSLLSHSFSCPPLPPPAYLSLFFLPSPLHLIIFIAPPQPTLFNKKHQTSTITFTCNLHVPICSIHIVKRPGAILHPGTLVATLEIDDPDRIKQAKKSTTKFPQKTGHGVRGDKINQVRNRSILPFHIM